MSINQEMKTHTIPLTWIYLFPRPFTFLILHLHFLNTHTTRKPKLQYPDSNNIAMCQIYLPAGWCYAGHARDATKEQQLRQCWRQAFLGYWAGFMMLLHLRFADVKQAYKGRLCERAICIGNTRILCTGGDNLHCETCPDYGGVPIERFRPSHRGDRNELVRQNAIRDKVMELFDYFIYVALPRCKGVGQKIQWNDDDVMETGKNISGKSD